ncbi:MAG: VanW family protein [Armatimonadota bacterium]
MTAQSDIGQTDALTAAEPEDTSSGGRTRKILIIAAVALATILLVGIIALAIATDSWVKSGEIAQNVTIGGLEVGGMTRAEAVSTLRDRWIPSLPRSVTVTFPGGEWEARREELGARFKLEVATQKAVRVGREGGLLDQIRARLAMSNTPVTIDVPVGIDENTLDDAVGGLAETVDRDPVDADFTVAGDQVEVIPGVVGRRLNVEATFQSVKAALADPQARTVHAVVETTEPSVTAEDLSHIEVVLADYATPYRTWQTDRTHNLKLAAEKLNEHVLHPGEEFSFNDVVGERLAKDGYRAAPIFIDGDVEPSTGGGICQIASTLYNVALLANLDMTERHHHSRPVDYVPTGRDATVYWRVYDLKFTNSLEHPVILLTSIEDGKVRFRMLGSREDDAGVEIIREGLSRISHGKKEIEDPELPEGEKEVEKEGRDGWRVTVYRRATRDGEVIREERLHTDRYAPQTRVVRIGTKPPEEEPAEGEQQLEGESGERPAGRTGSDAAAPDDTTGTGRTPAARESGMSETEEG